MGSLEGYQNSVRKYEGVVKANSRGNEGVDNNPVLRRQIQDAINLIATGERDALTYEGDMDGVSYSDVIVKPLIPDFLYKPLYGRPRYINIPEIRRLTDSPTAFMCVKTIQDEVGSLDWQIVMQDDEAAANEKAIDEVTMRLENPNRNKEAFGHIIKKLIRDILSVDAGVICKVYDQASYEEGDLTKKLLPLGRRRMLEFYAYDGGSFTISPNRHGVLPDQQAYYQYTFHTQQKPIPFGRDEMIYMMANPRTNNIYGVSPMEVAFNVVRYEVFGVDSGIDYYTRNHIPRGVISVIDGNRNHIKEFKERLKDRVNVQDETSDQERWVSSSVPVINQEVKWTSFELTPDVLRTLETQQWYIKLVFACFGVTPSELGFTEESNRATDMVQSEVFRRKAILPMLDTLEYYINAELVPEFGYEDVKFEFIRTDIQSEMRDQKLWESYLANGQRTVNEWRQEYGDLDPVDWGDEPLTLNQFDSMEGGSMFDGQTAETDKEELEGD